MSIWFHKDLALEQIAALGKNTMSEHLGMVFTEIGANHIKATMPVDHRTVQPYGLLHGGASLALAETLGSVGAALTLDPSKYICVGIEINANHLRSVKKGLVTGTATPIHIGLTTQVWDIRIQDEHGRLLCVSRHTVAVLKKDRTKDPSQP
jgi:1,4-dihydroxy-2-naphthoyl-CoA hydrolase